MGKLTKKMDNGWELDLHSEEMVEEATGKIVFAPFNGSEGDKMEWIEGDSFILYVGPELEYDGDVSWCDQHVPDLDDKLEGIIGDLGDIGSMECAHDIEREKVEKVLGKSGVTFDEAFQLIRERLTAVGIEEDHERD